MPKGSYCLASCKPFIKSTDRPFDTSTTLGASVKELTVFIGRFSPFHNGHADVLSRALSSSKKVLVLIGSSHTSRSVKNPFTYEEREKMIYDWQYAQLVGKDALSTPMFIEPLVDYPYDDNKWITQIQSIVNEHRLTTKPVFLTGANRDESSWYLSAFGDFFEMDLVTHTKAGFDLSATKVRQALFTGKHVFDNVPYSTMKFLESFMNTNEYADLRTEYDFIIKYRKAWEAAPYAPTFVTTDAVVVQSGHVLVVERDAQPGKGLWALPGGFLEQNERIVDGCLRELDEETKIEMSKAQLLGSIAAKEVFDHPDRSMRGRTITHAFYFKLKDTLKLPKVRSQAGEVKRVMWIPLAEALERSENWFEDHHSILTTMVG